MGLTAGLHTRPAETALIERARELLSAGPADAAALVRHVCQMPAVPGLVADHMAAALLGAHPEFERNQNGSWSLAQTRDRAALPDALHSLSFVVVDVETTGSRCWMGDRITEIGAIVVRGGAIQESFQALVNPGRPIPRVVTALTGITWEMVRDQPAFPDLCHRVLEVLEGHVFVGHNVNFDWRFVDSEIRRATGKRLAGRRLCTVRMARRLAPGLRRRNLDSLCAYYGEEIFQRHRAYGDAHATARVLLHMLEEARMRGVTDWASLQKLLRRRLQRHSILTDASGGEYTLPA